MYEHLWTLLEFKRGIALPWISQFSALMKLLGPFFSAENQIWSSAQGMKYVNKKWMIILSSNLKGIYFGLVCVWWCLLISLGYNSWEQVCQVKSLQIAGAWAGLLLVKNNLNCTLGAIYELAHGSKLLFWSGCSFLKSLGNSFKITFPWEWRPICTNKLECTKINTHFYSSLQWYCETHLKSDLNLLTRKTQWSIWFSDFLFAAGWVSY